MTSLKSIALFTCTVCLTAVASAQQYATSFGTTELMKYTQVGNNGYSYDGRSTEFAIYGVDPSQFNYGTAGFYSWVNYDTQDYLTLNLDADFKTVDTGDDSISGYALSNIDFSLGNNGNVEQTATLQRPTWSMPSRSGFAQYDDFQNLVAGQAFTFDIGGFTYSGYNNEVHSEYSLIDLDGGTTPISGVHAGADAYSLNVPAGALIGGHWYAIQVTNTSAVVTANAGFGGADSYLRQGKQVTAYFQVQAVPEPATMAGLGLGALALLRRRKNS